MSEQAGRRCVVCGGPIEAGADRDRCYSCHLDGLVPAWYARAERYEWAPASTLQQATRHPALGLPLLDACGPVRVCDVAGYLSPAQVLHLGFIESQMGLLDDD